MADARYTIDDLVERTGFHRRTIRYYVTEGLLAPPAGRGRGGFYYDSHLERLNEIRALRDQGLRLQVIRERLEGTPVPREVAAPELWARHELAPGLEVHVCRDVAKRMGRELDDLLRLARSLAEKGEAR